MSRLVPPAQWIERALKAGDLPYASEVQWIVRQHLLDLTAEFPSLTLKRDMYTHVNGKQAQLLLADGTLPMYYSGTKYNIPVRVWLPEGYPRVAPLAYVVPTPEMVIKPHHSFVEPSGQVHSSYLRNWTAPRSNLVDMSHDMSIQFGQEVPLYSKPPNWSASLPPAAQTYPRPQSTFQAHNPIHGPGQHGGTPPPRPPSGSGGSSGGSGAEGIWGGALAAAGISPAQPPAAQSPAQPAPDLQEAFRGAAVAALTERLRASLELANEGGAAELDRLFAEQATLTQREQEVASGVAALQAERHALEQCVLELAGKSAALKRWLAENEAKKVDGEVDADAAVVPADVLSRQALEAQAGDLAIEDALYAVEKALQAGAIAPDVYIKQVRGLCGRQLLVRALGAKVAARQHQLRRAFAAGGGPDGGPAPGPSVQLPQGDSWANTGILANPLAVQR
ncbi:hypothetical protein WJX81_000655 [Elliptochloris bilobata]|uniref:Uncharacterized protein n=1 Tax=Elliptochloris bilobata TaxID=381761 RepID=A0AAW1R2Q3_9CHLO